MYTWGVFFHCADISVSDNSHFLMLLIIFAFSCQQKCQRFSIAILLTIFTDGCQCFAVDDMYDLIA